MRKKWFAQKTSKQCDSIEFKSWNSKSEWKTRHAHSVVQLPSWEHIEFTFTSSETQKSNARVDFEFHNKRANAQQVVKTTTTNNRMNNIGDDSCKTTEHAVNVRSPNKTSQMSTIALALFHGCRCFATDATDYEHPKHSICCEQNITINIFII